MIQTPKFDDITSALFVQPHPDDNEIGAGGMMARLVDKGIPVFSVTVTQGDGGSETHTPHELAVIRHGEAQNASDILGVTYLGNLGFNNSNPGTVEEICEAVVKVMREHQVQTVISVDPNLPNEIHPVHIRVGNAVNQAFMRVSQPFYPYHENKRHDDAYGATILGHYFTSDDNEIIDVSDQFERKFEAIQAHESQMNPEFLETLKMYYGLISKTSPYQWAERVKLLGHIHTHCFAMPKDVAIEDILKNL